MINEVKNAVQYYFGASFRRKILDKLQEENKSYYQGVVLDLGGWDRGRFQKPREKAKRWIFADIDKKRKPNVVLDITRGTVKDKSIDVVNAIEVFEHVEEPEKGLRECHRILKEDGLMIVSAPFLFPIHAPARDFQRWTEGKWKKELEIAGFKIEKFETMGYFFTVLMDMIASFIRQLPLLTGCMFKLLYPFMNLLVGLDRYRLVRDNNKLNKYTTGYFMILSRK